MQSVSELCEIQINRVIILVADTLLKVMQDLTSQAHRHHLSKTAEFPKESYVLHIYFNDEYRCFASGDWFSDHRKGETQK